MARKKKMSSFLPSFLQGFCERNNSFLSSLPPFLHSILPSFLSFLPHFPFSFLPFTTQEGSKNKKREKEEEEGRGTGGRAAKGDKC
jgi:hypothetical protein